MMQKLIRLLAGTFVRMLMLFASVGAQTAGLDLTRSGAAISGAHVP